MSYITRTSNIVMVDQTCLNEAIARIGATATKNGANLNVRYNGNAWTCLLYTSPSPRDS